MFWAGNIAEHLLGGMATVALFTLMMDASDPEHAGTDYTLLACAIVFAMGLANFTGAVIADASGYAPASSTGFVLSGAGCLVLVRSLDRASRAGAAAAGLERADPRRGPWICARLGKSGRMQELKALVNDIPDFPKPGILFRDITPLLRNRFDATIDVMEELFTEAEWAAVDAVAGIESRGFILAAALAERRHKGFVAIRKKGKLPPPVVDVSYDLEYGSGVLEMQTGQRRPAADRRRARHRRHARRLGGAEPPGRLLAGRHRRAARHRHRPGFPLRRIRAALGAAVRLIDP